jgi:S-ribosylhomocysteine lyase LuxS involved in autoinducer biosynthesis
MVYHSEYSSQKVEQLGETDIDGTLEEDRRSIIPEVDIVFCTNLKLTIWHSLERAQLHSPQLIQEYLNKVDQLVIDQIKP